MAAKDTSAANASSAAIEALEAWASAGDLPSVGAPERWIPVLQHLVSIQDTRPVGLDAFLVPLA